MNTSSPKFSVKQPFLMVLVIMLVSAAGPGAAPDLAPFRRPSAIPFPADAPYDREVAMLGKMLFFDTRLSGAQNMSCVSCHNPSFGWEAPVARAIGAQNRPLGRHAPTLINMAWVTPLFWDGRAATLEEQAAGPITAREEMNATFNQVVARLNSVTEYRHHFNRVFPGEGITRDTILRSIATYERTIVSGIAPFDRWVEGEADALDASARRGFALFTGVAGCVDCHSGWNFSDNRFYDTGLPADWTDGRVHFKTPGLRNISLRAPYMHDGSISTLTEVVAHYVQGGHPLLERTPDIRPFEAGSQSVADIVAFLQSLTEERSDVRSPTLPAN